MNLIIEYGASTFQRGNPRVVRSETDLDEMSVEWQTPAIDSFPTGGPPPGFTGMRIMRVETEEEVPGRAYVHRLQCLGVVGSKGQKRTDRQIEENLVGFDEASEVYLTRSPSSHARGDGMPGESNMYCVSAIKTELRAGFWKVSKRYRGLIGTKPYQRQISVNEQVVTTGEPITNSLPGGWTGPQVGSLSLPRIVVTDSYVSTTAPPTGSIPGNSTPPDAPDVNASISFSGIPLTFNWPDGWKLASLQSEQIPGKSIWLITLVREFVYEAVPR